ncbi:MAG TPA: DUF4058 family protein [Gemmataceae bacterium]|nr:DUF4058 family protein [Gemmataceae bacterium]
MPSPFPGMDPFIEACGRWEDFHPKLIAEIERTLADLVPKHYFVRIGTRSYVVLTDSEGKDFHPLHPDVGITTPTSELSAKPATSAVAESAEPEAVFMDAFVSTEYRETFIDIYATEPERHLVTCIELLSPTNKRRGSKGWELYMRKRQGFLLGAANFVELDLLRSGGRLPMVTPWPSSPYALLACRQQRAPRCKVWPAYFQRPLPSILVPLSPPDADVRLDLQPLIAAIYRRSRYEADLDYSRPLHPPLTDEESAWLAEQLRARS